MSDDKPLLDAIWDQPHGDAVRLVYADWLEEHGQPERAEFIRVQCELARRGKWDETPQRADLEKRQKQLWTKHAKAWKAGLSPFLQQSGGFERGFPSPPLRALPSTRFLKLTAADFAGAPLWNYHLQPNHKLLAKVRAFPHLRRVGKLDFRHWLETPDDVRQFVASPNVRNVTDLNVGWSRFKDDGIAELAAGSAALPHLRRLDLEACNLTARAMETLVNSPLVDGLRQLHLFMNPIGSEGFMTLASAPRLGCLEQLDSTGCEGLGSGLRIDADAVVALCSSPHLRALKDLAINPSHVGDEGIRRMCATRPAFQLAVFRMSSGVGDAGAEALAAWPALADVRGLHLYANRIGTPGALALARSPYLNKVTELRLHVNPLQNDPIAVKALRDRFGDALEALSD